MADKKMVVGGRMSDPGSGNAWATLARFLSDGTLDTTFGTAGRVTHPFGGIDDEIICMVMDGQNRIVVGGSKFVGVNRIDVLARFTVDGALDSTFGIGGVVVGTFAVTNAEIFSVAMQADGKIVVGVNTNQVARFTSTGVLDDDFGTGGIVNDVLQPESLFASVTCVNVLSDGKMIVSGLWHVNDTMDCIFKLNADGSYVELFTFDLAGSPNVTSSTTESISTGTKEFSCPFDPVSPGLARAGIGGSFNGQFVHLVSSAGTLTGVTVDYNVTTDVLTVEITSTTGSGSSSSWGIFLGNNWYNLMVDGVNARESVINRTVIDGSGNLVCCGYQWTTENGVLDAVAKFDGATGLLTWLTTGSYGDDGDEAKWVVLDGAGKIVTCGTSTLDGSATMARFSSGGALDSSFGTAGLYRGFFGGSNDIAWGMVGQPSGMLVVVGEDNFPGGGDAVGGLTPPSTQSFLNNNTFPGVADRFFAIALQSLTTTTLTNVDPGFTTVGSEDTTITLTGTGFTDSTPNVLTFGSMEIPTNFVNSTTLTTTIPAALLTTSGPVAIFITNDNGITNSLMFIVLNTTASMKATVWCCQPHYSWGTQFDVYGLARTVVNASLGLMTENMGLPVRSKFFDVYVPGSTDTSLTAIPLKNYRRLMAHVVLGATPAPMVGFHFAGCATADGIYERVGSGASLFGPNREATLEIRVDQFNRGDRFARLVIEIG